MLADLLLSDIPGLRLDVVDGHGNAIRLTVFTAIEHIRRCPYEHTVSNLFHQLYPISARCNAFRLKAIVPGTRSGMSIVSVGVPGDKLKHQVICVLHSLRLPELRSLLSPFVR